MVGHIEVLAIPTAVIPVLLCDLQAIGINWDAFITDSDRYVRLCRDNVSMTIEVYEDRPGETIVVLPTGLQTIKPWLWPASLRLLGDVGDVIGRRSSKSGSGLA